MSKIQEQQIAIDAPLTLAGSQPAFECGSRYLGSIALVETDCAQRSCVVVVVSLRVCQTSCVQNVVFEHASIQT